MEKLEKFNNKKEQIKIDRLANESQVAYLTRASKLIISQTRKESGQGIIFDPYRVHEKDLSPASRDLIAKMMQEARRESSAETNHEMNTGAILELLSQSIGIHRAAEANPKDEATFEKTQRRRKFFDILPNQGAAKRETYWNTLFFPYNTEATRALAKEILDGKTIMLLGGGRARLKEEMERNNILPREVLNVDPFVSEPEPGADLIVPVSAADERLPGILQERGIAGADEIWAEYSVPAYLENPEEIKKLFQNIDNLLAPDGYARLWPLEVKHGTESDVDLRKKALLESLNKLVESGKYEIISFKAAGRPGFTLHKLKFN